MDLERLTTSEYGNLLDISDIKNVVQMNTQQNKDVRVNYENVHDNNSSTEKALKKAYENLMKKDSSQKEKIIEEFREFKTKNREWLEPKSVFKGLIKKYSKYNFRDWEYIDANLYDETLVPIEKRLNRIAEITNKYSYDMDIYMFEQFLAEKHLKEARKILNDKGIELSGDMLVGFSGDEVWANPKAFLRAKTVGCGQPALDFETQEGRYLLRKKVNRFAELYDDIRVDYAWSYCDQTIYDYNGKLPTEKKYYRGEILDIIEDEFRKVKGSKYKPESITYEFIANASLFNPYENGNLKPYVKDRTKIYCSNTMSEDWATTDAFKKRGWGKDSYILGATNHDCKSIKIEYQNNDKMTRECEILSKILKIPKEKLKKLNEFISAKFAEPMSSKHNMIFFLDALNLDGLYKDNKDKTKDYRIKIPANYQDEYFKFLEEGCGYNPMDALEKNFVAQGRDKTNPELYGEIVKYKRILQSSPNGSVKNTALKIAAIIILGILSGIGVYYLTSKPNNNVAK
ncbi:MAG: 4-alpha-glucanotransferase [bacterium]|nr:4-alpha-glucanotransferase [bacterium]